MADAFEDAFAKESQPSPEPIAQPTPVPEPVQVATPAPVIEAPKVEIPKPADPPTEEKVRGILHATLDEREKRQRLERENAELRAQIQPRTIPSIQDEEAYTAHVNDMVNRAVVSERFNVSESMAQEKHGADAVKAAMDWGMQRSQESPAFAAEYMRQKHPIDWAVKQHKRDALMKDLGDDPDAWVRKRYAEINPSGTTTAIPQASQAQAAPQPTPQQQPLPTKSLASATSAGGMQVQPIKTDEELFKSAFNR